MVGLNLENNQKFQGVGLTPNAKVSYRAAGGQEESVNVQVTPEMTAAELFEAISKKSENIAGREIFITFQTGNKETVSIKLTRQERFTGAVGDYFLGKDLSLSTVNQGKDGKWYACRSSSFQGLAFESKDEALRFEEAFSPEFRSYDFKPEDLSKLRITRINGDRDYLYALYLGDKKVATSAGGYTRREFMLQDFIIKQYETRGLPKDSTYLKAKAFFLQEYVADYTKTISDQNKNKLIQLFKDFPDPKSYNDPALRLLRMATVGDLIAYGISKPEDLVLDKMQLAFQQINKDIGEMCGMGIHPSSVADICKKLAGILQEKYGIPLPQVQQLLAVSIKAGIEVGGVKIGIGVGAYDKFNLENELRHLKLLPEPGRKQDFEAGTFFKELGLMALNAVKKTIPVSVFGTNILGGLVFNTLIKNTSVDHFIYQDEQIRTYFNKPQEKAPYSIPGQKGAKPTAYEQDAFASLALAEFGSIDADKFINQIFFAKIDQAIQAKLTAGLKLLDQTVPKEQREVKPFYFTSATGQKLPVFLLGGKGKDGLFHYLDPLSGEILKDQTRDGAFRQFCQKNSLTGHGQLSFLDENNKLNVYTTKADSVADGLDTLHAAGTVGAMVTMFIPGLGEVSLALFGVSLGANIASKFYNKEPWTNQEIASTVIQGMLIGGSGGAALLRAAAKTADKAKFIEGTIIALEAIGKTGFGFMLLETSLTGLQAMYEKDPEKFINFLINVGMLVGAYKAQKFGGELKLQNIYLRMGFKKNPGEKTVDFNKRCIEKIKTMKPEEIAVLDVIDNAYSLTRTKIFEKYTEFRTTEGEFIKGKISLAEYNTAKNKFFQEFLLTRSPEARTILKNNQQLLFDLLKISPADTQTISMDSLRPLAKALEGKPDALKAEVLHTLLAAYHPDTAINHSMKMQDIIKIGGKTFNLTEQKITELEIACLVHDIGKLRLGKKEFLDNSTNFRDPRVPKEEQNAFFEAQQNHPKYGQEILEMFGLSKYGQYALKHHLNIDGSGYPKNDYLGKPINPVSEMDQILKIMDVCNALKEPRVYKDPLERQKIINILREMPLKTGQNGQPKKPEVSEKMIPFIESIINWLSIQY